MGWSKRKADMTQEALEKKRAYNRERRRSNPGLLYAQETAWRNTLLTFNVDGCAYQMTRGRMIRLREEYGLTAEAFIRLYLRARGMCQLCERPLALNSSKRGCSEGAVVDHCHSTGRIRGILCQTCNRRLGFLESIDLQKAFAYLKGS